MFYAGERREGETGLRDRKSLPPPPNYENRHLLGQTLEYLHPELRDVTCTSIPATLQGLFGLIQLPMSLPSGKISFPAPDEGPVGQAHETPPVCLTASTNHTLCCSFADLTPAFLPFVSGSPPLVQPPVGRLHLMAKHKLCRKDGPLPPTVGVITPFFLLLPFTEEHTQITAPTMFH